MSFRQKHASLSAYKILNNVTPLGSDCGVLCSSRCCCGGTQDGMWLLPGEERLLSGNKNITVHNAPGGYYAVCNGSCDRETRPFSCRIFPLFPVPVKTRAGWDCVSVTDIRAVRLCPLLRENAPEITPRFKRAVRRAGRALCRDREYRDWLIKNSDFLSEMSKFSEKIGI